MYIQSYFEKLPFLLRFKLNHVANASNDAMQAWSPLTKSEGTLNTIIMIIIIIVITSSFIITIMEPVLKVEYAIWH